MKESKADQKSFQDFSLKTEKLNAEQKDQIDFCISQG